MKYSVSFVLLLIFAIVQPTHAQIELDNAGRIGIGVDPSSLYQVNIESDNSLYALRAYNNWGSGTKYGIISEAKNGNVAIGVYGRGNGGGAANRGVQGWVNGSGSARGYAIFGTIGGGTTSDTLFAGYFDGDVAITGTLYEQSDAKLKEGVTTLDGSSTLEKLMQLRATTYRYKTEAFSSMNMASGIQYGLIAQEVETVFPEFVQTNVHPAELGEKGELITGPVSYKGISYTKLIPLLLSAIQEQQTAIEGQQAEIDALKSALQSNGIEVNR